MFFRLNGVSRQVAVAPGETLLETLRERLGITSLKEGCSGQGQCGCCVVRINGRVVTSCTRPTTKVAGQDVVTLEGLAPADRQLLSRCFVAAGGVQCGFCTPGMVVRAAALLASNPKPSRAEISKQIAGHLCRCTGYVKILDAIELAARVRRGEVELPPDIQAGEDVASGEADGDPRASHSSRSSRSVGRDLPRYRGRSYALGEEPYVGDMAAADMLHGAVRLADHPRALVTAIDTRRAAQLAGVRCIVTAGDVAGQRRVGLVEPDWPSFIAVGETTCMVGDVIAAVAAVDRRTARQAAALIEVDYQVLEPLTDPVLALQPDAPQVHPSRANLLSTTGYGRGDVEGALAQSVHVVAETYRTQCVEHLFLEPEACLVVPDEAGRLQIYSQGQGVYDDRRQLCLALDLPTAKVAVTQVPTGGAFGGKEDLTVQVQTALLAQRTARPVRLVLSRDESIRMHPKRHPFVMDYQMGCDAEGRLTALRAQLLADTGAYASVGAKVIERAAAHACGPYYVPDVSVAAQCVYTNNPPCGAMRGFGVNQVAFAVEQMVDQLAARVGLDGYQIRELNLLREGQPFGPGHPLAHCAGLRETLVALKDRYYDAKVAGLACGIKNVGVGGGKTERGRARIEVLEGGRLKVLHGMTEMGQGLHTVVQQMVAESTGLPARSVVEVSVCTDDELNCGMTTSSRATVLVGHAVVDAGTKLRVDLDEAKGDQTTLVGRTYDGEFCCDWTGQPGTDDAGTPLHLSFGFATQVVILDEHTGKVTKVCAAHDVGKAINPMACEGQIEGAVHMGLGYALSEQLELSGGVPVSTSLRKLGVLRAPAMPVVEVILVEQAEPNGPYGARGIGEIGLVPTAPAVAAAYYAFDGRRRTALPLAELCCEAAGDPG